MASGALPHSNISISSRSRPRWRGFYFALHPNAVQGFYFVWMQYSTIQAFTACFVPSMQLYGPRSKTALRALQRRFLRLHPLNRLLYQNDTSGYNTTCATLDGIHAPGRAPPIPDTTATPGRCTGQHRPSIIIMYIREQTMPAAAGQLLPCADHWQVLTHCQQYRPGAPAEGSARRGFDAFHARRLEAWHRDSGQGGRSGTLHPAGQSSNKGRGGRRGTIGGYRRISFRAFAR